MAEASIDVHLLPILDQITKLIADEELNRASLVHTYPGIGDRYPDMYREGHVQSVLFCGLRTSNYFTIAEANYINPTSIYRKIDLAVWLPDARLWLYLELKPCPPVGAIADVLLDAKKLVDDRPTDPRDRLRGILAYGLRNPVQWDGFPNKYRQLGEILLRDYGFQEVGIRSRSLKGTPSLYVQAGLWVTEQIAEPAPVPHPSALLAQAPSAEPVAAPDCPRE
ncbi:MAG TPA: hypothetical protein VH575_29925 [Gemmataceae bacterium]|jgi:hypothetical protein